ncbi:flagellar basal body L-ring protein FlgH [Endozoicomonas sp. SM1973]|uniref:Flagellar L-ring protein n=1 Tax=Spartinivicinus marinus TaxID=2994442 RepID=A0A853I4G4_9GAMM|nr:flagellar basal body L-ring protein FlgH [Spartinivicinus marinus]MCX4029905.1 flagellar basal body L-ring protein FlgH [Spartinivicinus marinus]NYZ64851.1 flagellar basal body L-ring protein FlgH [Spartinivicinus marinus]
MKSRKLLFIVIAASIISVLPGCISLPAEPNDPAYAPVYPATPKPAELNNGAIYQSGFEITLYEDRKAHRVGDIITIQLNESTRAKKEADTELSKNTDATVANPTVLGKTAKGLFGNDLSLSTTLSADREFEAETESEQSNSLSGNITVTVSEVLPNGLLKVRGEKWLTLNRGDEYIRITGMVRPDDIGPDNVVSSQKVADARITYSGRGELADSNTAGWITRLILSAFFPF